MTARATTPLDATVVETPIGPLALVADGDVLVAGGFGATPAEMQRRLDADRRTRELRLMSDLGGLSKPVVAYFDGDLAAIDDVPTDQIGTTPQRAVWHALRAIPAGDTRSYGEIARAIGSPTAYRAVGSACGRNLIAPVVPCHRAVRAGGALGGYYYGLATKEWLLAHERRNRQS